MSQASIIINVSDREQTHHNGLSGHFVVPGRTIPQEPFGILVVYPTQEIQDIGEQRRVTHWLKARPIALDIVGMRSDAAAHGLGVSGNKEKWGLLLCEAEPDLPKSLLSAIEDEINYLNQNMPDVKMKIHPESKALVATNIEDMNVREMKVELSQKVTLERRKFVTYCRSLVTAAEQKRAIASMFKECQRLVGEGDRMWARPTEQQNINELHRWAAGVLGHEKPWAYTPRVLEPCPGCGGMIPQNVITCQLCGAIIDKTSEQYEEMTREEKSRTLYPERYAEETAAVKGK